MEGSMTVAAAEVPGFKHTLYLLKKNIMSCCRGSRAGPPEPAVGCKICSKINISIFLFFFTRARGKYAFLRTLYLHLD